MPSEIKSMPAPGANREAVTVVEQDGRHRTYSAEEWHTLCAELKGMRLCQQFSVIGDRLFKREEFSVKEEDTL
jgi:hypothetical protein